MFRPPATGVPVQQRAHVLLRPACPRGAGPGLAPPAFRASSSSALLPVDSDSSMSSLSCGPGGLRRHGLRGSLLVVWRLFRRWIIRHLALLLSANLRRARLRVMQHPRSQTATPAHPGQRSEPWGARRTRGGMPLGSARGPGPAGLRHPLPLGRHGLQHPADVPASMQASSRALAKALLLLKTNDIPIE